MVPENNGSSPPNANGTSPNNRWHLHEIDDEPDSCIAAVAWETKTFNFTIRNLSLGRSGLDSTVSVDWVENGSVSRAESGMHMRPLSPQHVNWRSASSTKTLASRLEAVYEPNKKPRTEPVIAPWPNLVEWAGEAVDEFIRRPVLFEEPEEIDSPVTNYLLQPFLPSDGCTIFFGPGDSGKGYLLLSLMYALCYNSPMFDLWPNKGTGTIYYLDYEDSRQEWSSRLSRLANGFGMMLPPNLLRIPGRGIPLAEQADTLLEQIRQRGWPRLFVVDSAVPACGGDPNEAETVRSFFSALNRFRCPSAVIAHETKAENDFYPFGSIFWHNLARWTVNVRSAEHNRLERHILLRHRKHNSGPRFSDRALRLSFSDDAAGELPAFTRLEEMEKSRLTSALQEKRALSERLAEFTPPEDGISIKDLMVELGETSEKYVKNQLKKAGWESAGKGKASSWNKPEDRKW